MEVNKKVKTENMYDIVISASNDSANHFTRNWKSYQIDNKEDFLNLVTSQAYSNTIFNSTRYRKIENLESFGSCIIFDIDNDGDSDFKIKDAQTVLVDKNISSIILPSRSHLLDKGKHGIKERFRIFIFMDSKYKIPHDINKQTYKELMKNIAISLGFEGYYDPAAASDSARLYYASPENSKNSAIEIKGNPFSIEKILESTLKQTANLFTYNKTVPLSVSSGNYNIKHYIYTYDYENINLTADFLALILQTESIKSQNRSRDKIKIKTASDNTYQYFTSTNLLYDFKAMVTYNPITYIKHMNEISKNIQAIEIIENILNIEYKQINDIWSKALVSSMQTARNSKELAIGLQQLTGFKNITIENNAEDYIIINAKSFHIKELGTEYKNINQIVKQFIANRKAS